jgi:hypothetical protein
LVRGTDAANQVIDDDLTMPVGRIAAAGPEETE